MSAPTLTRERKPTRHASAARRRVPAHLGEPMLSPGRPLSLPVRRGLERHLGNDLADVRIHDDEEAARLAEAVAASAFVLGSHVFFAAGRFDVSCEDGRRLLAHEVAHVVQNRAGGVATDELVPCHEAEADSAAARDWRPDHGVGIQSAIANDEQIGATPVPSIELPALRYSSGAGTGAQGTVKVADLVLRMITRTLRLDPDDRNGRVAAQLARLVPDVQRQVVDLARTTLSAAEFARLDAVLEKTDPAAGISTPAVGADPDDVAEAAAPTAEEHAEEGTHTHADGTTHTHVDGTSQTQDGEKKATGGFLAGLVRALFGGSLFAGRGAPTEQAAPSGAATEAAAPERAAAAAGKEKGEAAASVVDAETEQTAEGKPAAVTVTAPEKEAKGEAVGAAGAAPAATAGGGDVRISEPEAARTEVAAAAGSTASTPAITQPPAEAEATHSQAQERADAEDRTVLEAHGHQVDAEASSPVEPREQETAGAAPAEAPEQESAAEAPAGGPEPEAATPAAAAPEPAAESAAPEPTEAAAPTGGAAPEAAASQAAEPVAAEQEAAGPEAAAPEAAAPEAAEPEAAEPEGGAPAAAEPEAAAPDGAAPDGAAPEAEQAEAGGGPEEAAGPAPGEAPEQGAPDGAAAEGGGVAACMGGGAEAQPPTPDADAPSAACGGGGAAGGGAEPPAAAAPVVSASTPDAALATVSALPATDMQTALPQVATAATADVSKQRAEMPPPTMDRPSGAASGLDVSAPIPKIAATPYTGPTSTDKVNRPPGSPAPQPDLQPTPSPSAQQVKVSTPRIGGDQQLSEADAAKVVESIDAVPTTDPELQVEAGEPGAVQLEADADPKLVAKQQASLDTQVKDVAGQGAKDAAAPLGEADIRPHVPAKTLTAKVDEGASCPGLGGDKGQGGKAGESKYPKVAVDAIVAEKSQGDIQAGVAKAGGDFKAARDQRDADTQKARDDAKTQMDDAVQESNDNQVTLRKNAISTSTSLRGEWTDEEHKAVDTAITKSGDASQTATTDVAQHKRDAESKAQGHIDDGNRDVRSAREDAEKKAREEKAKAKKEKSGILGWIGSKISSFFDALKSAIVGVFDAARKLVRKAISAAKKLAHEAIELGRKAVVGAIKLAGDVIIAAGDVMLAAFPEAREKFRKKVTEVVDTATKKVNDAADALERGIQKLLDALGNALDCALQYLQAGYLAAVDALASVVKAALDAAQAFLDLLADWAAIIADIASSPIRWLKNLGRAAIDGVRNCLWSALKRAIKQWFNDKVEEVIGVGKLILNVLLKGCLKFSDIARMAWDGIKAALPGIVIQLIIEKLVALLIPAGAALSLIIDGLKAAWGAASRILAAFQKFMTFLKSVKSGNGAGAFADLVAAAAVAVIDFISNFLIGKLKGAGKGVGNTLKTMASKIGKALGKVGRAVGRGVRAIGRGLVRGAKAGAGLVKRGAAAVVRGGKRIVSAVARGARKVVTMLPRGVVRGARAVARAVDPRRLARAIARSRLGQAIGRGFTKVKGYAKGKWEKAKAKFKEWREKRKKAKKSPEERLAAAVAAIQPALTGMLGRGVSGIALWARLKYWKVRYGLSSLNVKGSGGNVSVEARVNPWQVVGQGVKPVGATLRGLMRRVTDRILKREDVTQAGAAIVEDANKTGILKVHPQTMGFLGLAKAQRDPTLKEQAKQTIRKIQVGVNGAMVSVWRGLARDPRELEVKVGRGGSWLAIARRLRKMFRGGHSYGKAAAELQQIATTGQTTGKRGASLARLAYLAYGQETHRQDINIVAAAMTSELAQKGRVTVLPQAPVGAGAAARHISGTEEQREISGEGGPAKRRELAARIKTLRAHEIRLAARWLEAQMAAEGLEYFASEQLAEDWMYEKILAHYGVIDKAHSAGGGGS